MIFEDLPFKCGEYRVIHIFFKSCLFPLLRLTTFRLLDWETTCQLCLSCDFAIRVIWVSSPSPSSYLVAALTRCSCFSLLLVFLFIYYFFVGFHYIMSIRLSIFQPLNLSDNGLSATLNHFVIKPFRLPDWFPLYHVKPFFYLSFC